MKECLIFCFDIQGFCCFSGDILLLSIIHAPATVTSDLSPHVSGAQSPSTNGLQFWGA